jgi:uncharacterized protein YndB with AHSA1/START domain
MANQETNSIQEIKNEELMIPRIFDAPRKNIWKAWTDPVHLMRWWGHKDFTSPVCRIDLRIGEKYLSCMKSKEGQEYWNTGRYEEIIPFERLVYTDSFEDEEGNVVPVSYHEMPEDDWPMKLAVTITFEDLGNKTRMTLGHVGLPEDKMKEMGGISWTQSFDKLAKVTTLSK